MSKLTRYQLFVAVAETGSILQAANTLHYSPAAVSKQISKLEEELEVQLFHRSHKKLEITEAGQRFYPRCKNILKDIAQAEDDLIAEDKEIRGSISITLSKALARSNIFDALASFTLNHPNINLNIRLTDDIEDLHEENLDFAFRLGKLSDNSHMIAVPLIQTQLLACASPHYLSHYGMPESFSKLSGGKLILQSTSKRSEALKQFFRREKVTLNRDTEHICDDIEGVYQSVKSGLGIGFMLDVSVQDEIQQGTFHSILENKELPKKRLYLMYKKDHWKTSKHQTFKNHIKEYYKK